MAIAQHGGVMGRFGMLRTWLALACAIISACTFPRPPDVSAPPVDAPPRGPLIDNHQAADIVLGQPDFATNAERPPYSAVSLLYVNLGAGPDRVWAANTTIDRIIGFMPLPSATDTGPAIVLGRPDFTDKAPITSVTAANFAGPSAVADTGAALLVVDAGRHRVLLWNQVPTSNQAPADLVLGQPGFTTATSGSGAGQMNNPGRVWSDGRVIVVCDTGNHRVLVWHRWPTTNGQPADVVIGQPAFGMSNAPAAPSASTMNPGRVTSDGQRLIVADDTFNRILVWSRIPTVNGESADLVLGQADFETAERRSGDATLFNGVGGVVMVDGALFVADPSNHRVLLFDPLPATSVADVSTATRVLGQPHPGALDLSQPVSSTSMKSPWSLAVSGRSLFVAEWGNHRVTRFQLLLP